MEKASSAKTWYIALAKDEFAKEALSRADSARSEFNEFIDGISPSLKKWASFLFLMSKLKDVEIIDIDLHSGITIELAPELICESSPIDFFQEIASSMSRVCEISIDTIFVECGELGEIHNQYLINLQ